ncbi:HAD family hydrolase [Candidatus Pyrohabitans sp.]
MPRRAGSCITAVIFDLDGTLVDFNLDIKRIKRELFGFNSTEPLLETISALPPEEKRRALARLVEHEVSAARRTELIKGAREVVQWLRSRGVALALATRNCRRAWREVAKRHGLVFDAVITREDAEPKPSPEQFLLALRLLRVRPENALAVGDHAFDYLAARRAGIRIALLPGRFSRGYLSRADFVLRSLKDLEGVVLESCD